MGERVRMGKCSEWRCGWHGPASEALRAPDPFNPGDELAACPKCRTPESLTAGCDEPGCTEAGTCGTPTPEGYRTTCGKHRPA